MRPKFIHFDDLTDVQKLEFWREKLSKSMGMLAKLKKLKAPKDVVKYEERLIKEAEQYLTQHAPRRFNDNSK